jgi:hypothetical protein
MLKLKCPRHPRFNGINPKASCQACITLSTIRNMAYVNRVTVVEPQTIERQYADAERALVKSE